MRNFEAKLIFLKAISIGFKIRRCCICISYRTHKFNIHRLTHLPRASRTVTVDILSNNPVTLKMMGMMKSTSVSVTSSIAPRVNIAPVHGIEVLQFSTIATYELLQAIEFSILHYVNKGVRIISAALFLT